MLPRRILATLILIIGFGGLFSPSSQATEHRQQTQSPPNSASDIVATWQGSHFEKLRQALESLLKSPWLAGCQRLKNYEPEFSDTPLNSLPVYIIGIHPLHNPQRLFEVYGPIVDHLDAHIAEAHFKLEASRNYEEFDKKLDAGHFDFAMPNPYQTVRSLRHGYRVFGKMDDDENFRGILLLRRDSAIRQVSDLKGKAVSYPAPTALAATMMPQYYLHTHGIDVNHDIKNLYVGSQESSIMNVLLGHVAAAATWPVPWKSFAEQYPDRAKQLFIKWQTGTLPNNGWVVHSNVPAAIIKRFQTILFALERSEEGRKMLARIPVSRFQPATEETYRVVQEFLDKFSTNVRSLEQAG